MLDLLVALVAGFVVAVLCTPVGVSGAVLLLPAQGSLMGLAGPSVSSTNLLFNVISTPGGLSQLHRAATPARVEVVSVICVAVPAAVGGALLRVTVLADAAVFRLLVAVALLGLAATLVSRLRRRAKGVLASDAGTTSGSDLSSARLILLVAATSLVGAAVGFGGGSLLTPALVVVTGRGPHRVAPLALLATLVTSLTGLAAYSVLEAIDFGARPAGPVWGIGIATGVGGLAGSLLGARLQPRIPERPLTGLLAALIIAVAIAQLARG